MAFKLSKEALRLLEIKQPIGFRVNYRVNCEKYHVPDAQKIFNFFKSHGNVIDFHHMRDGLLQKPMYEGHATFKTEQEALRFLGLKDYQFAPGFSLEPTNKPTYQVKRITEYPSRVFTGFNPASKAEDLCHRIMTFPYMPPRKKYNPRI